MMRRTGNGTTSAAQLSLPYEGPNDCAAPRQIEPLTVRIPEAVRLIGIRRSKLYELIASGDLETVKVGQCTLIPMTSLRALIERGRHRRS
jgi:excisionase family DNA binding protein